MEVMGVNWVKRNIIYRAVRDWAGMYGINMMKNQFKIIEIYLRNNKICNMLNTN
jgi:hypothetical protein